MIHGAQLLLERCPHCGVAKPLLSYAWGEKSANFMGNQTRMWATYACATCGQYVLAASHELNLEVIETIWPATTTVSDSVPTRAREYLEQAINSLSAPAGAVMLTASAVDAMLKDKGLKTGTLNSRIDDAAKQHLITVEMAAWAHEIRLDANDQRHADESASLPTIEDAEKVIEFANALAQFLFVLPARVARGRKT